MTPRLITLTAAASLVLAAGCSSVRNDPAPTYGAVGSGPTYPTGTTAYDSVQYGYVRNVQQLDTSRRSTGAGPLLGAVVGGVLGNQVGSGTGRAAATAAGAIGGAVIGKKIEERNQAPQNYFQVDVQLDNGDFKTFDYADLNGLRVGDRVRVQDNQLQRW